MKICKQYTQKKSSNSHGVLHFIASFPVLPTPSFCHAAVEKKHFFPTAAR